MKDSKGNIKKELQEQDVAFLGVPNVVSNKILELKLEGYTDRAIAKKVNLELPSLKFDESNATF